VSDILVEQQGAIATVIFNRPRMRNAISLAMWADIATITQGLVKDDSVRAIVYRGAGTEAFASGADISEFPESRKDTETSLKYNATTSAAYAAVRECPKPTIAMVYGYCMGGAMGVAMACDLRFAAEGSKFGIPAARLSIIYPAEAIAQLVDLVGPAYGPALTRLRETLARVDPEGRAVRYTGKVPFTSLPSAYHASEVFVFASSCENMPNILLEAMSAGLPIACSDRGPMPEILGDAGCYFDPESVDAAAAAIERLVESPELRARCAEAAFGRASAYSWKRCADETMRFLASFPIASRRAS